MGELTNRKTNKNKNKKDYNKGKNRTKEVDTLRSSEKMNKGQSTIEKELQIIEKKKQTKESYFCYLLAINFILLTIFVIIFVCLLQTSYVNPPSQTTEEKFKHLEDSLPIVDDSIKELYNEKNGHYNYGRYLSPLESKVAFPTVGSLGKLIKQKEWHYVSISTNNKESEDYFLAFAILDIQYVSGMFAYIVEKETGEKWETSSTIIFPKLFKVFGLDQSRISNSSINGCSSFRSYYSSNEFVDMCFNKETKSWVGRMNLQMYNQKQDSTKQLRGLIKFRQNQDLILLFPLEENDERVSYVHKSAALQLYESTLRFDDLFIETDEATVAIDWTKAIAKRRTEWFWASCSGHTTLVDNKNDESKIIGINLSQNIYDNVIGVSQENGIWFDDKIYIIDHVVNFIAPENERMLLDQWKIKSNPGQEYKTSDTLTYQFYVYSLNLNFTPIGSREEHIHAGILISDFVQPYGVYSGTIELIDTNDKDNIIEIIIDGQFGVVEKHLSLW
eukprot:TRINITY_DN11337_c0_g1_i1.p1 TRINITY_DN11337_c0_g1~~TRINITY_DN11337_c0_g1_i1.p1  ORF type:complete len:502 (+),score=103.30 TRINITY_DN11337_c0_g1_i1:94-1599(+)